MFLGEYKTRFSGHARLILPKKFREELHNQAEVVLSRGLDGCIWGFDKVVWQQQAKQQLSVPVTEKTGRDIRRYLFSAAEQVKLDRQSRLIIPKMLMEYARLKSKIVVIGAGDHFEIWDQVIWSKTIKKITNKVE